MKKLTRILTMGGFGLLAALATAGPATAATPSGNHGLKPAAASHNIQWGFGESIVGYYRTLQGCELAGNFGERVGNWDDHNCTPVRLGVRRGAWALQVASDDNWDRLGFGVPFHAIGGFPTRFRPYWPGTFRPGPGIGFPVRGWASLVRGWASPSGHGPAPA
ncbi:hypothetical protein [Paractinoplanes durhamensis]|uniref:hypothetical protein n=1 Tax=Paractinoplanes durhamensis TaxID=113563 RepID=UPI00362B1870